MRRVLRAVFDRRVWLAAVAAFALGADARGDDAPGASTTIVPPLSFAEQTKRGRESAESIDGHIGEIEALLAKAVKEGKALKASCIEEKLRLTRHLQGSAKSVQDGWSMGEANPAFAQRNLDRMLLLQLYASIYAEEAHACVDSQELGQPLAVGYARPNDTAPTGLAPVPPVFFERPPLSSPF
jgi:hypothetical protein